MVVENIYKEDWILNILFDIASGGFPWRRAVSLLSLRNQKTTFILKAVLILHYT